MGDNKTLKNFKKYICVSCDFECRQKCDINRHVLTAKHKKNMERLQEVTTEVTKATDSNDLSLQILQELKLLNRSISEVSKNKLVKKNIIINITNTYFIIIIKN